MSTYYQLNDEKKREMYLEVEPYLTISDFKKELRELDTTAHLIKKGYIPKDEFLELLAPIIIVTYDAVKPYIKFVQDKRETKHYAFSFEWLYDEANNWWKENRPDENKPTRDGI